MSDSITKAIIEAIFNNTKSIAVVGLSPNSNKDSHIVAKFMQEHCFKIYPIYPKEERILGERVYRSLLDVSDKIDCVVMFRKGEFASELLESVLKKGIHNFWLQCGITNDLVKMRCKNLGINYIQDKCIMIEYAKYKKIAL